MANVIPLQLGQVENLDKLALYVDAIQNPKKYLDQIDTAITMLTKLQDVINKSATINNAELYLEQAQKEREKNKDSADKREAELLTHIKNREENIEKLRQETQEVLKSLSEKERAVEGTRQDLTKKQHQVTVAEQHILSKEQHLRTKEQELKAREDELKRKEQAFVQIINGGK